MGGAARLPVVLVIFPATVRLPDASASEPMVSVSELVTEVALAKVTTFDGDVPVLAITRFLTDPPKIDPILWLPEPLKPTVPEVAVRLPPEYPLTADALPPIFNVLVPMFIIPEVSVKLPVTFVTRGFHVKVLNMKDEKFTVKFFML